MNREKQFEETEVRQKEEKQKQKTLINPQRNKIVNKIGK